MKKIYFTLAVATAAIAFSACGNHSGSGTSNTDSSSSNVVKPATNDNATNPSLADTAYSNNHDSTRTNRDSAAKH